MRSDQGTPNLPNANVALSPRQRLAGSDLLPAFDAIEALLFAAAGHAPDEPMMAGYLAGVRVQGERLAALGGTDAMALVLDLVSTGAAHGRRRFVEAAWSGLPGWTATTGATR